MIIGDIEALGRKANAEDTVKREGKTVFREVPKANSLRLGEYIVVESQDVSTV